MQIILLSNRCQRTGCIHFGQPLVLATLILVLMLGFGGPFYFGYHLAKGEVEHSEQRQYHDAIVRIKRDLLLQKKRMAQVKLRYRDNMDALAQRLGRLQAHVIRLDALGNRLITIAQLENGEFDFESEPAQGGPGTNEAMRSFSTSEFVSSMAQLNALLQDREQQLGVLESLLMNRSLQKALVPEGRPVKSGWLSSSYGMRTDPFKGKRTFHKGIDFAGALGSDVVAVASGVVTTQGSRSDYGHMIDIDHGKGLVTRYAHNKENLVQVGDRVKRGQKIALMGSTGRSTGPHVHFEVFKNGRHVNPRKYIRGKQ